MYPCMMGMILLSISINKASYFQNVQFLFLVAGARRAIVYIPVKLSTDSDLIRPAVGAKRC